jgi:hypothetical protein
MPCAECRYAECCVLFTVMLSVIMLNVNMVSVIMLSVKAPWQTITEFLGSIRNCTGNRIFCLIGMAAHQVVGKET